MSPLTNQSVLRTGYRSASGLRKPSTQDRRRFVRGGPVWRRVFLVSVTHFGNQVRRTDAGLSGVFQRVLIFSRDVAFMNPR